jgi:NhaA family Na+:H+ antiporter
MITRSFQRFFAQESAGGIVLAIAALAALIVSNSAWGDWYLNQFLMMRGDVIIGESLALSKPLLVWVNDLWMAVFFFLVGLEIKREFVEGELSGKGQLRLPAIAALGGMVVPALIYAAINAGDANALQGWAIPAATDIAFALGILLLLGKRVPTSLKVFLTAVAIIDDLGAIVIIALFYTQNLSLPMLGGAVVAGLFLWWLNRRGVSRADVYIAVGLLMWLLVLKSGVHATLAGVITALAIPMRDAEGNSPVRNLEHGLHPWVAFGVLPMFAFANAGVSLQGLTLDALLAPVPLGIALGLLVGKTIGVFGATWLVVRAGWAPMPKNANMTHLVGVAVLCGIGFTMSLFIGGLAFSGLDPLYATQLKIGVLMGSITCGILGSLILAKAGRAAAPVAGVSAADTGDSRA